MNIIDKIKALWAMRKVVSQMGDIKRGWKTWQFWVTLLGGFISVVAAIKGMLPATVALVVVTILTVLYNLVRGFAKADESGIRQWWKTSEVWLGVLGIMQAGILQLQTGGVNAEWLTTAAVFIGAALSAARDLSHQQPEAPADVAIKPAA